MNVGQNKETTLQDAIKQFVVPGCHISIGGFTINRNPMAAVYEIIRQKITGLHLYAHSNGQGVDELIGAKALAKLEIAYGGSGKFASTCIRFRKAIEEGSIVVEDYSNYQMTLRFLAGSMGVPFLPTRSSLGTDIINKWGFSKEMRQSDAKIPNDKLIQMDNPFSTSKNTDRVVLVPAINPDVTIIHVQKADKKGNCRIEGLSFADVEQAKAARHLIVTCEQLYTGDELKRNSDQNQIPFIHVDAVVHMPHGAYPTACYNSYDYDPRQLKMYARCAKDEEAFNNYLEQYVLGTRDHGALMELVGREQIEKITADPETGYASNLDRT